MQEIAISNMKINRSILLNLSTNVLSCTKYVKLKEVKLR